MAHFAKLIVGNIVERVEVVSNDVATTEQAGRDFLNNLYKTNDLWFQTYKDGSLRKNFAAIGYKYDQYKDAFISPKPYNSWILNETTCLWEAPILKPQLTTEQESQNEAKTHNWSYAWNESNTSWDLENSLV
jgi:hypothetical protein